MELYRYNTPDVSADSELVGLSVAERISTDTVSDQVKELINLEKTIPVSIGVDRSLRPKIIDKCGMACVFCHNEGTPVAAAYTGSLLIPNPKYEGGRVSVFENRNHVDFLPGVMRPGEEFVDALTLMKNAIYSNQLHLTGGEPTLHPKLTEIIHSARVAGYTVKMTSNGESGPRHMQEYADAGLSKINFSIFGTTPEELAEVQNNKFNNINLAAAKLRALNGAIAAAIDSCIDVDANIVMANSSHSERVERIIELYDKRVTIRILNDLNEGDQSFIAIYDLLSELGAKPKELYLEAGSSNSRVKYKLPDGRDIFFKQIRRTTLPDTCATCDLNNDEDCKEGYYGVRLYIDDSGQYKVGICLQRMDLVTNIHDFISNGLADEVNKHKEDERILLTDLYKNRIQNKQEPKI